MKSNNYKNFSFVCILLGIKMSKNKLSREKNKFYKKLVKRYVYGKKSWNIYICS